MDDDLLDPLAWGGLPWRYRFKLFTQAFMRKRQLLALADEVWVSTPHLQNKYAHLKPMLVTAKLTPATTHSQHDSAVLVCYHGTASHSAEFKWLLPIMQEVLQGNPHIHFELFADSHTAKLFRKLPRTAVLHPMTWPQYLAYILVIDQTFGDLSVTYGAATPQTFHEMLQAALADNPNATVYVKTHPQTTAGHKRGYLTHLAPHPRVVLLTQATNPMHLLSHMDKVYVVTSTMGFEALLMGKPVVCFGVPWYAGWGVTDDRCVHSPAAARRTRQRSVRELFAAAYIHYTHYINPITHYRGEVMDVMPWLLLQQQTAQLWHGPMLNQRLVCMGMRRWKQQHMQQFFGLHLERVAFDTPLQAGDQAVHWGADAPNSAWRVEDGFIRSVGLGSDLIPPMSLVLDKRGMYFDPARPSDLEHLLQHHSFKPDELQEARAVRKYIVSFGITKYNLEPLIPVVWQSGGRQVLVVVGQVEDDASIRLGCTFVKTNLGLLQAVRHANPKAFIVYKPHPDVATGNRAGHLNLQQALQWADHVETHASVVSCIHACNELHTMTSLSGFDALLRGKPVTTYGLPFYAGWGLTTDLAGQGGDEPTCFARRTRRLSLDELVAGTLLRYPLYWDHQLKGVTTCMAVLRRIQTQRDTLLAEGVLQHLKDGYVRRLFRKLKHLLR